LSNIKDNFLLEETEEIEIAVGETDMMTEIAEATTEEKEDPDLQETTSASIAENEDTGQTNAESLTIRLMPNAQVNVLNVANKATFKRIVLSVVLHQK